MYSSRVNMIYLPVPACGLPPALGEPPPIAEKLTL